MKKRGKGEGGEKRKGGREGKEKKGGERKEKEKKGYEKRETKGACKYFVFTISAIWTPFPLFIIAPSWDLPPPPQEKGISGDAPQNSHFFEYLIPILRYLFSLPFLLPFLLSFSPSLFSFPSSFSFLEFPPPHRKFIIMTLCHHALDPPVVIT